MRHTTWLLLLPIASATGPRIDHGLAGVLNQNGAALVSSPEGWMNHLETGVMQVLYNQHGAALRRYACRLTSNATHAEEIVQQTLVRACQHEQVVDGVKRSTRAWLFTVARDISSNGSGAPEAGGSDELNSALDRTLVADAFTRLSAEHRAVLRRAYYYGWTTAQISADLQIPDGTVKSRLHYALLSLRRLLHEMGMEQ